MDTLDQTLQVRVGRTRNRRRTIKERREIVEETLLPDASVSRVARRHDVNANQVFYWRKLFREGRLGISMNPQLLPVKVEAQRAAVEAVRRSELELDAVGGPRFPAIHRFKGVEHGGIGLGGSGECHEGEGEQDSQPLTLPIMTPRT